MDSVDHLRLDVAGNLIQEIVIVDERDPSLRRVFLEASIEILLLLSDGGDCYHMETSSFIHFVKFVAGLLLPLDDGFHRGPMVA